MKLTSYRSPLGEMTILADDQTLYGLWFNDQKYFGGHYDLSSIATGMTKQGALTITWLKAYFAGEKPSPKQLNIAKPLTTFRQQVYQALMQIPAGETVTYQELSTIIQKGHANKNLARAIGNAVGHNEILLVIPCHRVIGSDGSLTGYAGGLARKRALLKLEGVL